MSDAGMFVQAILPSEWPKERADHEIKAARRVLGEKLIDSIGDGELYAIRLRERREPMPQVYGRSGPPDEQVIFRVDVSKVQTKQYVLPEIPDYASMSAVALSWSAVDEIKRRVRREWRAITRKFGALVKRR